MGIAWGLARDREEKGLFRLWVIGDVMNTVSKGCPYAMLDSYEHR